MLKLRYEWSNYKHLRERNEAAGITKEIIDKVQFASDSLLTTALWETKWGKADIHFRS